jgi:hypothetical protein
MSSCCTLPISLFKLPRGGQAILWRMICIVTWGSDNVSWISLTFLMKFWVSVTMAVSLLFQHHIQFIYLNPPVILYIGNYQATQDSWNQVSRWPQDCTSSVSCLIWMLVSLSPPAAPHPPNTWNWMVDSQSSLTCDNFAKQWALPVTYVYQVYGLGHFIWFCEMFKRNLKLGLCPERI